MQNFHMYMCDVCGFARQKPGMCPHCRLLLTSYTKEIQRQYQVDMEEPVWFMSMYR